MNEIKGIVVKEGESLPDLKEAFSGASMIDQNSIKIDIQNVDSLVPGTYDVVCTFDDVNGNQRKKSIQCEVQPDLIRHVSSLEDLTVDWGESLPVDNTQYDEYVESVIRDDSMVDINVAGSYPLTYSILGTNGEVDEVQRLATVLDKPESSPTPSPAKTDTKKNSKKKSNDKDKTSSQENANSTTDTEENLNISGNITVPDENDHIVATGDNSSIVIYTWILMAGAVAASLAYAYSQERNADK